MSPLFITFILCHFCAPLSLSIFFHILLFFIKFLFFAFLLAHHEYIQISSFLLSWIFKPHYLPTCVTSYSWPGVGRTDPTKPDLLRYAEESVAGSPPAPVRRIISCYHSSEGVRVSRYYKLNREILLLSLYYIQFNLIKSACSCLLFTVIVIYIMSIGLCLRLLLSCKQFKRMLFL